jgi:hypothetical protein
LNWCFWSEWGVSLLPVTRRTSAPRGVTPVIRHHGNWRRGYASDLNPVEGLLASFEGVELANLAADIVQKVTTAASAATRRWWYAY